MQNERKSGRRPNGESAWTAYTSSARTEAMRRIARCAEGKGLTMQQFAALAGRDRTTVLRTLESRVPQRATLDTYCQALGLPAIARRALRNELTDRDIEDVERRVILTGVLEPGELEDRESVARAARAYALAASGLDAERDPVLAFIAVVDADNPNDDGTIARRAHRYRQTFPERVREFAEIIMQSVPAARDDENRLLAAVESALAEYVPAPTIPPNTTPIPELAGLKEALGREAAARAAGKPLPRYRKPAK